MQELPDHSVYTVQRSPIGLSNGVFTTPQKARIQNDSRETYSSPTGRSRWQIDDQGKAVAVTPLRQLPKCQGAPAGVSLVAITPLHRHSAPGFETPGLQGIYQSAPRNHSWPSGSVKTPMTPLHMNNAVLEQQFEQMGPNVVDIDRIVQGIDVRTTLMLRNLPNDMNVHEFQEVIKETAKDMFDFSYLRIDYNKNTNVGYGFVNFVDPKEIIYFVQRWQHKEWIPGRSIGYGRKRKMRIADVSYATVQGFECLIAKFRNSSVLDEFPDYRPKLWYTGISAKKVAEIGTERPFPPPDNMSKKQRSRDNAAHVGIYDKSNRGQNSGRQHRSQFDRGTPAQQQEEMMFHQMSPMQNGYPVGYGPSFDYNQGNFMPQGTSMVAPAPINVPAFAQGNGAPGSGYNDYGYYHTNPAMSPPGSLGYGMPQFTDPFASSAGGYNGFIGYGGHASNYSYGQPVHSMTTPPFGPNGMPNGHTRPQNMPMPQMRDAETARRQVAENKIKYPEAFADYIPQCSPTQNLQGRRNGNRAANLNIPKAIAEETEMADNAEYNGQYVNGTYPAANGYGPSYHQQY